MNQTKKCHGRTFIAERITAKNYTVHEDVKNEKKKKMSHTKY